MIDSLGVSSLVRKLDQSSSLSGFSFVDIGGVVDRREDAWLVERYVLK